MAHSCPSTVLFCPAPSPCLVLSVPLLAPRRSLLATPLPLSCNFHASPRTSTALFAPPIILSCPFHAPSRPSMPLSAPPLSLHCALHALSRPPDAPLRRTLSVRPERRLDLCCLARSQFYFFTFFYCEVVKVFECFFFRYDFYFVLFVKTLFLY